MVLKIVFLIFVLISTDLFAQNRCDSLFISKSTKELRYEQFLVIQSVKIKHEGKNANLDFILKLLIDIHNTINIDLVSGIKTPTWDDFNTIERLKRQIKNHIDRIDDQRLIENFYRDLNQALQKSKTHQWQDILNIEVQDQLTQYEKYAISEYGLKVAYQELLQTLNPYLPSRLRFREVQLDPETKKETLRERARRIVKSLTMMHERFFKLTDFKKTDQFKAALLADESAQNTVQNLIDQKYHFAMRRPETARFWTPKVGFHNQHVTQSSRGYFGNKGRNATEASYLNLTTEKYKKFNNELKPKYGFLSDGPTTKEPRLNSKDTNWYGDDIYFFKNEINDRVTFTLGDSLNALGAMDKYGWMTGNQSQPKAWDHIFTPWKFRELIQLFMDPSHVNFDEVIINRSHSKSEYVEIQYWGPVTLDDVKAFAFTSEPPSGDFLKELQKRKIQIFDYTDRATYKPWSPK